MGYVHKPIPNDVLASMPPAMQRLAIEMERDHLRRVHRQQGRLIGGLWLGMCAGLVIAILLALGGVI